MEWVAQAGLSNAVAATVLAVLAAVVGFVVRRPALSHGLWLLVLIKLVTPPVAPVAPLTLGWTSDATQPRRSAVEPTAERAVGADVPPVAETVIDMPEEPSAAAQRCLLAGWGVGALAWWSLAGWRIVRFQRMLRAMRPGDPALAMLVESIAARVGLARSPRVGFVPGRVPPLVWSMGTAPCIVLPEELWGTLEPEARESLLTHELAHLRRRDHWTRWLELLTGGLYWWLPVAWWARRALREAEEQCCDAWVVAARPESARAYARALLATLDFLSEPRPATPLAASGIGPVSCLKRRMTMIIRAETPKALTWRGRLAVLALGAALLPIAPTWAQSDEDKPRKDEPAARERSTRAQIEQLRHAFEALGLVDDDVKEQVDKAFEWAERAVELGQLSEEGMRDALEQAGRDIDRSLKHARAADRERREEDAARDKAHAESSGRQSELDKARAEIRELHDKLRRAEERLAEMERSTRARSGGRDGERRPDVPPPPMTGRPRTPSPPAPDKGDHPEEMRPGRRGGSGLPDREPGARGRLLPRLTPPERNLERRMRDLEEKLDMLLKDRQDREKERQDREKEGQDLKNEFQRDREKAQKDLENEQRERERGVRR